VTSLRDMRRSYARAGLSEEDLAPTWLAQFQRWFADAHRLVEPNAVVLATATADAAPSARTVLLKDVGERGFVVFTNYESRKGRELAANPRASLCFPWTDLQRQVIVDGVVARLPEADSDAYWPSRPRGSRLGALASSQSAVLGSRAELVTRRDELDASLGDEIPRPAWWGGLVVEPIAVEFWQGREDRLHDRLRFRRVEEGASAWVVERLSP
jgi:pyridoxamine 5'-phosphate oxidase